jgi:flagellar protein FlaF
VTLHAQAQRAYARPDAPARSARSIEYDLLARATRALRAAETAADRPALIRAVHENARLWRTLALDVADPGNALPSALRAQLFYLYEFTEAHSRRVRAGEAAAGVLVEINTAVMRGLRGEGGV